MRSTSKSCHMIILFSFILCMSQVPFPALSATEKCNPNDKKVLLQIKQAWNNPYQLASWDPNTDCCDWYVVKCDSKTHRIVQFDLFDAEISGQIPEAIGSLPSLQFLNMRDLTDVSGPIPKSIANLTNLNFLRLSYLNLTGPVPTFLSQLKKLTFLDVSFNDLTGSIPSSLSQLQNLDALRLEGNQLTGSIPDSFGTFTGKVPDLDLSENQLTGPVPRSLGALSFSNLDFHGNQLSGDISFLFGTNKALEIADFSSNKLAFDLTNVAFPQSLTSLDLSHNMITGSLPQGLSQLNLQYLNVSYNILCGKIPVGGKLQSFDSTSYLPNKCLCGAPLPSCT
ncbi:polygalacturonase inhibitor-like [Henckelia pumila]|uniref:polygalacturonase inhibitor-like n=1 Tax=Henckelia pumila TaxID=405737 RepID=UPI003C6E9F9D